MSDTLPTLWHIDVSHFSEKARWALVYKGVEHRRRAVPPGAHIPTALFLTRGEHKTFPVLTLDGRNIGDSTAVIAALEQQYPEPPLYPEDTEERRKAVQLEEFFDEELGPYVRHLSFYELQQDPELFEALIERTAPGPLAKVPAVTAAYTRTFLQLRWSAADGSAVEVDREKIVAAFDRIDDLLAAGGGDYLVGDSFSVADLTAASLLNPLVLPNGGPLPSDAPQPKGMAGFLAPLEERPAFAWVEETYRRHRKPAAINAPA
jgi:glutathione S-transferase